MSKINAVRLINLNYNNNAIRVSDECFHFHGESTLISLRNGGGKSVLVQMMMAPFVHKRYRDAKDRPFESYFTTSKPSFILVEWALDRGAGYVMAGMMVRRAQDSGEDHSENLDIVNIISEYRTACAEDIAHLPVVEKKKKEIVLKNFTACRQLFESYKKDKSKQFFYYDMSNTAQARQYFDKLAEYQIYYKEWETIIKKVNLKESGLSDLFAECRDEKGLVEKWFLDAVESKLNKEKNRMKEFQSILEKYVGQYKDNQSKISRRDTIRSFQEAAGEIRERALEYRSAGEEQKRQENRIACFIQELDGLQKNTSSEQEAVLRQIEGFEQELKRAEYEELSVRVYDLEKEQLFRTGNRDMIGMERDNLEQEAEEIQHNLRLFACAKQQQAVDAEWAELNVARQKLEVSRKRDEDLEPERKWLGYRLKRIYEAKLQENLEEQRQNLESRTKASEGIAREREKTGELELEIRRMISRQGALKSRIKGYSRQEEQYNSQYQEDFSRNILGVYEPGMTDIKKEEYNRRLQEEIRNRGKMQRQTEEGKEELKSQERAQEDRRVRGIRKESRIEQLNRLKRNYEQELEDRTTVLKYLDLEERFLYDKEKILAASAKKMEEIAGAKRILEKREDELQREYRRLTEGIILELPKNLEQALARLDIHPVYGMEWLRKNGYDWEKNRNLARSHPFLPYALILSKKELGKLEENMESVYTSFPVPIVIREQLEDTETRQTGGVVHLPGISFYVLFNENLLDEVKLRQMAEDLQSRIAKTQDSIKIRKREYEESFSRRELIDHQEVTREKQKENIQALEQEEKELGALREEIRAGAQKLSKLRETLEKLQAGILEAGKRIDRQKRQLEDFGRLMSAYDSYTEDRETLEKTQKQENSLQESQKFSRERMEKLQEELKSLEIRESDLSREEERLEERYQRYQKYGQDEAKPDSSADSQKGTGQLIQEQQSHERQKEGQRTGEPWMGIERTPGQMEARYEAITAGLSSELKELEEREQKASARYQKAADELEHLRKKFQLEEGAWRTARYDRKEEDYQEQRLKDRQKKIEGKTMLWNEEDKRIAVLSSRMEEMMGKIQELCGERAPLPKEELKKQDFEARKNQLRYRIREAGKQRDALSARLGSYGENLTALAEYSMLPVEETVCWDKDFSEMDAKELRNFKGTLIRDYNQRQETKQNRREILAGILNRVIRIEAFQEEFYKKPLEAMLALCEDADRVLKQLDTTVQSYDNLMEKLQVDISLVEKEKARIVELLTDYVQEVHKNLGRIDVNSTISIRNKPIKMLQISLPGWEENAGLYDLKLNDFIDEVTQKGLAIFEKNENAREYFGTHVTTRNLYDTVVGIGNVQIGLYKIEAEREYPITWAEVSRNSGGEGFLSAFVVLSSLLYYMRRDEADLFADRNEGKVLLMDNPFAQTNASHLLKPLMDMAKKTNTQLICLTGLGGESIYSRFDNIYVLNLVTAGLRGGMQYLKAEHLRGSEPEAMVLSQIEVMEQQELIF